MSNFHRKIERLSGGETELLTPNYWEARSIAFSNKLDDEEFFKAAMKIIPLLDNNEIKYLYWELAYTHSRKTGRGKVNIMKEYLLNEYTDRKYHLGRFKQ